MQDPAMTPAETPASSMDQLRQQDTDINVDVNVTPINIMTSKNLSKEYRELLKVLDKKNRKEGTCNLLKMCIKKQVIPRTFDLGNVELYDNLCNESKARWDATTFFRIEISLEHHLRSLENLNKTYKNAKKCLFTKLLQFERDIIENTLRDKIRRAQKFFERKHNRKINHLSPGMEVPEVQYNDVLRVTGLFLTKTNVWVLCWSNDNQFSNLTATAVRFI